LQVAGLIGFLRHLEKRLWYSRRITSEQDWALCDYFERRKYHFRMEWNSKYGRFSGISLLPKRSRSLSLSTTFAEKPRENDLTIFARQSYSAHLSFFFIEIIVMWNPFIAKTKNRCCATIF